jgi:Zn-dependent M16 (insulinase) family peptidase
MEFPGPQRGTPAIIEKINFSLWENNMSGWRLPGLLAICLITIFSIPARSGIINLEQGQQIGAFKVESLYDNEEGKPIGIRFRHIKNNFVLDLLRIQSLPQAFMWVNSAPPDDQGEPHTCEHLMLGKGNLGRYVASMEEMYLGSSSAFTAQLQTCYHFHTAAGDEAFFKLMEVKLDALLHPNFSDEEIRREVCNMGYSIDPVDSTVRLEEKGTVYNEMVSSYERPWGYLSLEMGRMLYGRNHPLSNDSGGLPDAIRTMTPADMRKFIEKNYHLSNMGMIVSIDDSVSLEDCVARISEILERLEAQSPERPDPATADDYLPAPQPGEPGAIKIVSFPSHNEKDPGLLMFAWPPVLNFDNKTGAILDLLLGNLSGGETSNLFHKFIDSQTRVIDIGANAVFGWATSDQGHPIYIGLNNIRQEACTPAMIDTLRGLILDEITAIASYPDNSPELLAFNERAKNRISENRRDLRNFLNTPPGFGFRGTGSRWMDHLKHLQKSPGFRKQLTLDDELNNADSLLASGKNFWKDYIAQFKLLSAKPIGVATCPSTKLQEKLQTERDTRIADFILNLKKESGTKDNKKAIAYFKKEYDAKTAIIDSIAAKIEMPKFIDNPPLTLDDQLHYKVETLPGGGNLVNSTFENMTSATAGLAFRMDVVPESLLVYVGVLPSLLTDVGAIKERKYQFDEMRETIRREIMELRSYYSVGNRTGRVELVVRGSGGNLAESQESMRWLDAVLYQPLWTEENLPRLRDAIDLALSDLRNTMRGSEESWVDDPANSYWRQDNPLLLAANSFLTQEHHYHRLHWLLKDAGSPNDLQAFSMFMKELSDFGEQETRADLLKLLGTIQGDSPANLISTAESKAIYSEYQILPENVKALAKDAAEDLKLTLGEIPDKTLAEDWRYLCAEIVADLAVPPQKALAELKYTMDLIRHKDNVRGFMIANSANLDSLRPALESIVSKLSDTPSIRQHYDSKPLIASRLKERFPKLEKPVFVGLVNDNTSMGVFINSAPCASFEDTDPDILLKFLSARLYGGGGAHSMFMKTWSAGLAYSNGLRSNEFTGRLVYYAERCPELAQTMQFVVNELTKAPYDPSLAEYAVAQAFAMYRSGSRYEARGEAQAADLADGLTPDKVRRFRETILEIRKDPNLYDKLYKLMEDTYGTVLPGYGPEADKVKDGVNFIIAPESQFKGYEDYLKTIEGNFPLYRIYPRDYWMIRPMTSPADRAQ